eukprot:1194021-Prorocentrum_minimum.AAC.2
MLKGVNRFGIRTYEPAVCLVLRSLTAAARPTCALGGAAAAGWPQCDRTLGERKDGAADDGAA